MEPTTERRELRATRSFELRAASRGDGYTLTGYASVFDSPYEVHDFLGQYVETIRPGAFTRTLDHGTDVRLLVNHDGVPLARTKSGTLSLTEDSTGLLCEAQLDAESPLVRSVKSAMDRGDMDEMSFQFSATRQTWNEDYSQRDVHEARLFDVSVVTFPASPATSASLRSAAVARYGADLWGRIEASLLTGDPLDDEAQNVLRRALSAVDGLTLPDVPGQPESPAETAHAPATGLLRLRAAALELAP